MNARSLQEFWKRHHKFLGITGSGIVLLTFVVREALRENLKDASDAIANAQVYFSLSEKNDYIAHRLKYVSDATSTIYKDETEMREHRSFFGAASMNELTEYSNALGDFGNDSATFQQFADDLQCNATDRQELKTLQGNVQEIEKANQEAETSVTLSLAIEAMAQAFAHSIGFSLATDPIDMEKFDHSSTQLHDASEEIDSVDQSLIDLSSRCGAAAEVKLIKTKSRYKHATYASYVLYGSGWLLALIGQIYGGKSGADE
jgi:hypothetical protein